MAWPAAIAGGAALAGQFISNIGNKQLSEENRVFQRQEAFKQRNFQERMRNTQWQAGIADMTAAGVNPALAYSQGGASAPMGAAGSGAQATVEDVLGPAVSSAQQARRLAQELKLMQKQTDVAEDTALKLGQDRRTGHAQEEYIDVQRKGAMWDNILKEMSIPGARNISRFEAGRMGQSTRTIRSLLQSVFGSGGAFRAR